MIKDIFKKKIIIYHCPKCNSTNLEYYTYLKNSIQVALRLAKPKYIDNFICNDCDFSEKINKLKKEYK